MERHLTPWLRLKEEKIERLSKATTPAFEAKSLRRDDGSGQAVAHQVGIVTTRP
jgi:hypothetical protein